MAILKNRFFLAALLVAVPVVIFFVTFSSFFWGGNAHAEADVELDPVKQKQIWDNEHITFVIEKRMGQTFLNALLKSEAKVAESLMRKDFRGEILAKEGANSRQIALLSESKRKRDGSLSRLVKAEELVAAFLTHLKRFKKVDRQRLRVLKIKQLSAKPPRWQAKLLIEFEGVDHQKQPLMYSSYHWIESTIPTPTRIDRVASVERWKMASETWRNSQSYLMTEITSDAGLDKLRVKDNWDPDVDTRTIPQYRSQIAVADYNKDGQLDIAVAFVDRPPLLLERKKGKGAFRDTALAKGLRSPGETSHFRPIFVASWIDFDNDGWPDLILGKRLFHNKQGRRFVDVTDQSGLTFANECMGVIVADYDADGLLDIYALYQHDYTKDRTKQKKAGWVDDKHSGMPNQLWRNEGGGRFRDVTAAAGAGGGNRHTFAAAWFYYDNDRFPDLYIANDFGTNVILRNRGDGTFADISDKTGAQDYATSMGVAMGDVDNDGNTDIYVANMFSKMGRRIIGQVCADDYPQGIYEQIKGSCAGNRLYMRKAGGGYRDYSEEMGVNAVGWAFGATMFDMDGDGWLDIYSNAGFMSFDRDQPDG